MTNYTAFPVHLLPEPLARFVRETADALGCDPAYVALPALATTAAAIGTTRAIAPMPGWCEPAVVWALVVARSGSLKSPAMDKAVDPLRQAQFELLRVYEAAQAVHETAMLRYERDIAAWKRARSNDTGPPEKPNPPRAPRIVVADTTLEAIAPILADNPRGVLLARDELRAWVESFGQYKGGRGGDAAAWLEFWRAGTVIVDRKSGERRTLVVPRAAVSVCGTIQPGIIERVLAGEHTESGFAARLLMAQPPERPKHWSRRPVSPAAVAGYQSMLERLLKLRHADSDDGAKPVELPMSTEADAHWAPWYCENDQRRRRAESDAEAAALAKIEAYAARFALIFELVGNPDACAVNLDAMRRGTALADWFAGEALRIYGTLSESDEARGLRRLLTWISLQDGAVTVRDLMRHLRAYPTADHADAALNGLVQAGLGIWEAAGGGPAGGRPTRRFRLLNGGDADETPKNAGGTDVLSASAVDAGPAVLPANGGEWGEL